MAQTCPKCGTVCIPTATKCDCGHLFNRVEDQHLLAKQSKSLIRQGVEMVAVYFALRLVFGFMGWGLRNSHIWFLLWAFYRIAKGLKLRQRMRP